MGNNSFYSYDELKNIGFKSLGTNVLVSKKASVYSPKKISIGNNVRIDDFCVLSGKISFGNNIHVSAGCMLFAGDAGIVFKDFSCVSSRGAIYAISDDFSGEFLANSTIDNRFRNVISKEVVVDEYAVIGTGSTVLPGVKIGEGCAVGAMSLVNKNLEPWGIYYGRPCVRRSERSKNMLKFLSEID